jgi:hypothetical protein
MQFENREEYGLNLVLDEYVRCCIQEPRYSEQKAFSRLDLVSKKSHFMQEWKALRYTNLFKRIMTRIYLHH